MNDRSGRAARIYRSLLALVAFLVVAVPITPSLAAPENLYTVDKTVAPIRSKLAPFKDGQPRIVAAIADASGRQQEFVEDELVVSTASTDALNKLLARWQGKVLETHAARETDKAARYLVRINPDLAKAEDLERLAQAVKFAPQGRYRLSSTRGLGLLAAAAKEKSASRSEKASAPMDVEANWVPYQDSITEKSLDRFAWLEKALRANCGHLLREEVRLLQELVNGGPNAARAEQQLMEQIPNADCVPPKPTFVLSNGLVLPEVDGGSAFSFILQPPAGVAQGFTASIVGSQGGHVMQPPYGGTLYGGRVQLNSDGKQLALYTPATSVLYECARTETFTIQLSHANGVSNYQVTLPVRLKIPGQGSRTYTLTPGNNVNIPLCAAGGRGAMSWSWTPGTGDPFPPAGLSLVNHPNGDAAITGTANTASYQTVGALKVQQGSDIASVAVQLSIAIGFDPVLSGNACGQQRLTPDVFFRCELPRPTGYSSHTWAITSGALPAGLSLVPNANRWYIEGTVPFLVPPCALCSDPVGMYPVNVNLSVPGFTGVAASRSLGFDVGIPFRVLTQNAQLRPSALPLVANTGDDNGERMQMMMDRIGSGTFDIVALQEVFDETQRDQLSLGYSHDYNLLWGPDEGFIHEESGLALLVKGRGGDWYQRQVDLHAGHYTEKFNACAGADCLANKGFSVTQVRLGLSNPVWVVNTHLQAPQPDAATRLAQLTQIMAHVATLPATDPVLLIGDLNIIGGGPEYFGRLADVLAGWEDAVIPQFGNATLPLTSDHLRNAYSHFWDDENHILEHELEDVALQSGTAACGALALATLGRTDVCSPPITHPSARRRLDHILIRQGTQYRVFVESVQLEDTAPRTAMCRDRFQVHYADAGHTTLRCYLSDHFGLSANLRLTRP